MSNTEGLDRRDMGKEVQKATTLCPEVVVEGKERMECAPQEAKDIPS